MNMPMEHPVVSAALKDNAAALAFVRRLALVMHTHDDAIDLDAPLTDADLNAAFTLSLVDLPRNTFYSEHFDLLNPIVLNSIVNWRIATELERNEKPEDGDLTISFIIRSSYIDIVVMCALIIGGIDWAVTAGVELRRWAHSERWAGYLKNLKTEKAVREAGTFRRVA
jgi:hypothetical protein